MKKTTHKQFLWCLAYMFSKLLNVVLLIFTCVVFGIHETAFIALGMTAFSFFGEIHDHLERKFYRELLESEK